MADLGIDHRIDLGVLGNVLAAAGSDLQVGDPAVPLGIFLQQAFVAVEPVDDALRIVEAVHSHQQGPADQAFLQFDGAGGLGCGLRQPAEAIGVDAHREHADAEVVRTEVVAPPVRRRRAEYAGQVAGEVGGVVLGLEADQVVFGEGPDQLGMVGQGGQDVGRRHRDVQEEADAVGVAAGAQGLGEGDQVVVVHPEDVVRLQQRAQAFGEELVDAQVAAEVRLVELREVQPVMQDRPQHAVGEAVVVLLEVVRTHVGEDVPHVAALDGGERRRLLLHLAAPAEPEPAALAHGRFHRDGEPPGGEGASLVGYRHPVGDHYESRHRPSSQRMDRRMAELIRPAIE
ncbi:hypothetical protein D9M71_361120 [compost metagenome]